MRPLRYVYLAGPLTKGDPFINVHVAVLAADRLRIAGYVPFVPHLFSLWQTIAPFTYEDAMALDFAWLERCDALVRLPGESAGSDREVEHARRLGLPVFLGVDRFLADAPHMAEAV